MKKYVLYLSLLSTLTSFSSTRLSYDEYLKGIFTSSSTKEIMREAFDYNNDLAVVSDRLENLSEAKKDALLGLKNSIKEASEKELNRLLKNTNISGIDFDSNTMSKMAEEISNSLISKAILAKSVKINDNDREKYLVLYRISRKEVEIEAKKEFSIRLSKLIYKLNDYYQDLIRE